MAQNFMPDWISGHLQKHEKAVVSSALERMGMRSAPEEWQPLRWELLNWFVEFAQVDLESLSDAQSSAKDEEIQVIQLLESFNLNPWVPSREEMKVLQGKVLKVISDLVEAGSVRIGPIPVEFVIWRGQWRNVNKSLPDVMQPKGVVMVGRIPCLIGHPPAEGIAFQIPPVGMDAVLHVLAQLLGKYPSAVRRCRNPDCRRLFARFKAKSRSGQESSCSRECQTRSWAKEQYKRKKQEGGRTTKAQSTKRHLKTRGKAKPNGTKKRK